MLTPNEKEYNEMSIFSDCVLKSVQYTLVTKGRKGMELYDNGNPDPFVIPTEPVDVYNVSGAGDVVVAVMAVGMSCGLSPLEAAKVANLCAGYAVTKTGTCVITENKYNEMLEKSGH
jgi:D-beta-D-heptose 7-phosphate kinase/D-beta-D-heptose 1-phosphate adenosyltransferase